MWFAIVFVVIIGGITYKLLFWNSKDIFKEHGIREVDTSVAVSKLDAVLGRKSMIDKDNYAYKVIGSEKYCGIREMGSQLILIKDLELIKKVLIKDFNHFVDRRPLFGDVDIALKKMLPMLEGEEWRGIRSAVSPIFSSGKIRRMMLFFNSVGKEWVNSFNEKAKARPDGSVEIDVLKSVNEYTVDVILSAVFGLNVKTIKDPDSPFAINAARLCDITKWKIFKAVIVVGLPKVAKAFKLDFIDLEALGFFERILEQGLKSRMSGDTAKRNDFLQLLVDAKKGELKAIEKDEIDSFEIDAQIKGDDDDGSGERKNKQWLTEQTMNSQCLVFFMAGFSTVSNVISFTAYTLAVHQDVQDKLRKEVGKIVKPDGTVDYDDVGALVYLDMVLCEVLRKYPVGARLERTCVRDYKDDETGLVVKKGTVIFVPVNAIHHDEQYYDNPNRFDPEHFSPDKKAKRLSCAYLPFGMGPRSCIGMRFARIEVAVAIAHLVHNFRIQPTKKTPIPITGVWFGTGFAAPKDLELKLTPINK